MIKGIFAKTDLPIRARSFRARIGKSARTMKSKNGEKSAKNNFLCKN